MIQTWKWITRTNLIFQLFLAVEEPTLMPFNWINNKLTKPSKWLKEKCGNLKEIVCIQVIKKDSICLLISWNRQELSMIKTSITLATTVAHQIEVKVTTMEMAELQAHLKLAQLKGVIKTPIKDSLRARIQIMDKLWLKFQQSMLKGRGRFWISLDKQTNKTPNTTTNSSKTPIIYN